MKQARTLARYIGAALAAVAILSAALGCLAGAALLVYLDWRDRTDERLP